MQVELQCTGCSCRFVAPPEASAEEIVDQMYDQGSWYPLGEGETFEDMIFATLVERGAIRCPECGDLAGVNEESLGQMAMELLAQW